MAGAEAERRQGAQLAEGNVTQPRSGKSPLLSLRGCGSLGIFLDAWKERKGGGGFSAGFCVP